MNIVIFQKNRVEIKNIFSLQTKIYFNLVRSNAFIFDAMKKIKFFLHRKQIYI
jgi:hypothetical protein